MSGAAAAAAAAMRLAPPLRHDRQARLSGGTRAQPGPAKQSSSTTRRGAQACQTTIPCHWILSPGIPTPSARRRPRHASFPRAPPTTGTTAMHRGWASIEAGNGLFRLLAPSTPSQSLAPLAQPTSSGAFTVPTRTRIKEGEAWEAVAALKRSPASERSWPRGQASWASSR